MMKFDIKTIMRFTVAALAMILPVFAGAAHGAGGDLAGTYAAPLAGKQEALASVSDASGGVIVTGYHLGVSQDFHTVKFKSDGTGVQWSADYDKAGGNDSATAVVTDSNGDVIVTGYAWNGINYDIHTEKYAGVTGALLWRHSWNGAAGGNDYASSIAIDSLNNIYVGGYSQSSGGDDDFILIKYASSGPNPDGTPMWAKTYGGAGGGHDRIYAVAAGPDGVAATGESRGASNFDIYTRKYDFNGNPVWEARKTGSGDSRATALAFDTDGNVAVAGYLHNGTDRDIYVAKLLASSGGAARWERPPFNRGHNDEPSSIAIDASGYVYVAGYSFSPATGNDFFVGRYDGATGAPSWEVTPDLSGGDSDIAASVAVGQSGDIFVAGHTNNGASGFDDFRAAKISRASGAVLWNSIHDAAGKGDRAVAVAVTPNGVAVAGWSDAWTSGATDYDFRVAVFDPGAIDKPSGLTAATLTTTSVRLAWTDNSAVEDGFLIERKIGEAGVWQSAGTASANAVEFIDNTVAPDLRYYYRIAAFSNSAGNSGWSNEATARTTIIAYTAPTWVHTYAGPDGGEDYAASVAVDSDGNPVVTGYSFSNTGSLDYFTRKINRTSASAIWSMSYNDVDDQVDAASSVAVTGTGNAVVTGYSSLYGGGARNTNDIYTVWYSGTDGAELGNAVYNGPAGDDDRSDSVAVASDGSNNTVVIGYGRNVAFNDDIYVIKYDGNRTRTWAATPYDHVGNDYPAAVAFDAAGNIFVSGYVHNGANYDWFVAKYNGANGAMLWPQPVIWNGPGNGNDQTVGLVVDASGDVYVTGFMVNASGFEAFYTVKYNGSTGAVIWSDVHGGGAGGNDRPSAIAIDPVNGEIVVAGTEYVGPGNNDIHIVRYTASGALVWHKTLDRLGSDDRVSAMSIDLSGSVCIAGSSLTGGTGGSMDAIAVKYDYSGSMTGATIYAGAAGKDDDAWTAAANRFGEAYVAGYTRDASDAADYLVFRCAVDGVQPPAPLTGSSHYTRADLSWSDNSLSEDGYRVERMTGACGSGGAWAHVVDLPANSNSYSDEGLNTNSQYCFSVQAYKNTGDLSRRIELGINTTTPPAPSLQSATSSGTTEVLLTWTDTTTYEDGFTIERCAGTSCDFSMKTLFNVSPNLQAFLDNNAVQGTVYRYRINAYRAGKWVTQYSSAAQVQALAATTPTLVATRQNETAIRLNWTDTNADETGFRLERCPGDSAACAISGAYAPIGTFAAGSSGSFTDQPLAHSSAFTYRVVAYKTANNSWEMASATASASTTVGTPDTVTAVALNTTDIRVTWVDNFASETGFVIERCEGASCDFSTVTTFAAAANATSHTDTTACQSSTYRYRVYAAKTGDTLWPVNRSAATADVTTPAASYANNLSATRASETRIDLSWTDSVTDESGFIIERKAEACAAGSLPFAEAARLARNDGFDSGINALAWSTSITGGAGSVAASGGGVQMQTPGTVAVTNKLMATHPEAITGDFDIQVDYSLPSGASATTPKNALARLEFVLPDSPTGALNYARVERITEANVHRYRYEVMMSGVSGNYVVTTADNSGKFRIARVGTTVYAQYWDTSSSQWLGTSQSGSALSGQPVEVSASQSGTASMTTVFDNFKISTPTVSYQDSGLNFSTDYCYRLKTFKTASCGWEIAGNTSGATTSISAPGTPAAAAGYDGICSDIRITDSDGATLLPHWIESGCGTTATKIWARVPSIPSATKDIYLHWGNPAAASVSNGSATFEFFDDFQGTTINASKWVSLNPDDVFMQNNGLYLKGKGFTDGYNNALISQATFNRAADRKIQARLTPYNTGGGMLIGWDINQSPVTSAAVNPNTIYGLKTYNNQWYTQEKTNAYGVSQYYSANTAYDVKIELRASGAGYFSRAGSSGAWTSLRETTSFTDSPMRIAVKNYTHNVKFDHLLVMKYAVQEPAQSVGAVERGLYSLGASTWEFRRPVTLTNAQAALSDMQVQLSLDTTSHKTDRVTVSWTDTSATETGFIIERCAGASCDFSSLVTYTAASNATSYTDTAVTAGETYCYRVKAERSGFWTSAATSAACATIALPSAPTALAAAASGENRVNLSWTDNTQNETRFIIERCEGTGCSNFTDIGSAGHNTATFNDTSVCNTTAYSYRVKAARSGAWTTAESASASATTATPGVPSAFTASAVSEVRIDLAWLDNSISETGFMIERCKNAGCSDFAPVATTAGNATAYSDTGLDVGTTYNYRVKAASTTACPWETAWSATASATTLQPAPPSGLAAPVSGTTTVNLSWNDNTDTESGFTVERCSGAGCDFTSGVTTFTTAANVKTYQDNGVCASTPYSYRVRAYKTDGPVWTSAWSNIADALMPTPSTPVITVARVNENKINVTWTDGNGDETGFRLFRCSGAGCQDFAQIQTPGQNVVSYDDQNLPHSTLFTYKIQAYKTASCAWATPFSNEASAATAIVPPGTVSAVADNTTGITLTWTDSTVSETGFRIERCAGTGCSDFVFTANAAADAIAYQDNSVCAGTGYTYRVRAERSTSPAWTSSWSASASASTPSPSAPSGLTVTATADTKTELAWTDTNQDETVFRVERCVDTGGGCANFAEVGTSAGATTAYADSAVAASTTYCYRIRAGKTAVCGWDTDYSNIACDMTYPATPTALTATPSGSRKVVLSWIDPATDEDGFEVEVKIFTGGFVNIATIASNVTMFTDTRAISPGMTYEYRVRAFRGNDRSPYSAAVSATMPPWQTGDTACGP
ncbi:MAG: DUF2341 domain-containing protein [Nitrospirae bacterium]|nr:DUF2341 domain-containing protein [Nitrospirota bacterium]